MIDRLCEALSVILSRREGVEVQVKRGERNEL